MNEIERQILKNQFQIMIELQVGKSSDEAKELFFRCDETNKLLDPEKEDISERTKDIMETSK